jgi:hypothetical protein
MLLVFRQDVRDFTGCFWFLDRMYGILFWFLDRMNHRDFGVNRILQDAFGFLDRMCHGGFGTDRILKVV